MRSKSEGRYPVWMKSNLFEGGTDLTALKRLRWPVVVNHAAWSFSLSSEEEGTELGHLKRKKIHGERKKKES